MISMRKALQYVGIGRPNVSRAADNLLHIHNEMDNERRYTPDLAKLEQLDFHYLFVPDALQRFQHGNEMLWSEEYIRYEAFTQLSFNFLMNDLGVFSHPLLFENLKWHKPLEKLPVKGELYRVSPHKFVEIDMYYSNGVRYIRKPILTVIPFTRLAFKDKRIAENLFGQHTQSADVKKRGVFRQWAWTYFAPTYYWDELLTEYNNPSVKAFDNPNGLIRKYYRFTRDQYDDNTPF